MSSLSTDQILALAPDNASASAGRQLASTGKWLTLGSDGQAVWGECQGSGKLPYQTQIDLSGPTFKCSCPSRKFPCKHGLGLFLLLAQGQIKPASPPGWVQEWLQGRAKRAEAREKSPPAIPPSAAAKAKRQAQRDHKVQAGLAELQLWLSDLSRTGLAQLPSKPPRFFESMAARLIDAQARGLARMVHQLSQISLAGSGWSDEVLRRLAVLHLAVEGYSRINDLPPLVQADLKTVVGFNEGQAALLQQPGISDQWLVVGQTVSPETSASLLMRRVWLLGQSGQTALLLDFSPVKQPFAQSYTLGEAFEAEAVFFPSNYPLRALIKGRKNLEALPEPPPAYAHHQAALAGYAAALARFPWLEHFPMPLAQVTPLIYQERHWLLDSQGQLLPLHPTFAQNPQAPWHLLALSGGHPLWLFGEWDGQHFWPHLSLAPTEGL